MSSADLELYGVPFSTCTRRVLAIANFHGQSVKLVPVDLFKGEHKSPKFLELQPFGQIPALKEGAFTMFESRAIAKYLDNKFAPKSGKRLVPTEPQKYALVETWLSIDHEQYNPNIATIVSQKLQWHGGATDEAIVADKFAKLQKVLDVYDKHLSTHKYLAGEYSLADVSHLPYTDLFYKLGGEFQAAIDSRPNVARWWKDISSRPEWIKTLELSVAK
eukprot:TRINITY_DN587_c0_g1_i3.p1 TRINITY_DN587_c0_g1~~TRINITY_DN587_c0_g1_i3.p1  ORF type:complete len:218 (-),score=75.28 TRINITY_DN587_c0_g1_i3:121-774(-)